MRSARALNNLRLWLTSGLFVCAAAPGFCAEPRSADSAATRVVHHFDFDERESGNLEEVPKYWTAIRGQRFPRFVLGTFDYEVGMVAPPSFHLASEGRNVAHRYSGPETRVRENSEYRVEGYIRADRLIHARACLSAQLLDTYGQPLANTLVRSRYVGGPGESVGWLKLELHLPAAPPEARTIGLTAWVLQGSAWDLSVPARRHIRRVDVYGGAWFDDITIHALPRVEISTSAAGNVLAPGGPQELRIILADQEDAELEARLSINDADGKLVETHQVSAITHGPVKAIKISVDHLPPGLYEARLDVHAGLTLNTSRQVTFARLSASHGQGVRNARPFGVLVEPQSRSVAAVELALLRHQVARSVKLPVWTGLPREPRTIAQRRATDRLLQALTQEGFALTGVFFGPPSAIVRADGPFPRPLIELLAGPQSAWLEHLASVVAPYASVFRWWQVGPDGRDNEADTEKLAKALTQFRDAMQRFITVPLLALPGTTELEPGGEMPPVQQLALAIGPETRPEWIETQIERYRALNYEHVSAFIRPLPPQRYLRLPRLANWAQRILMARHAGVDTVFVPQTWGVRETAYGEVTEPAEEYLILRTIADLIADAVPAPRSSKVSEVTCLAFHDRDWSVLALWDVQAPPEGSSFAIQLGGADRQIDLWGRSTPLEHDGHGRQIVKLSAMPVFVDGIDRSLIELRTAVSLTPDKVESGTELVQHTLEIANRGKRALSGELTLDGPDGWEITPRTLTFSVMPQKQVLQEVKVHYPHNEPARAHSILAKITLTEESYYLEVPLLIELGLKDVDVWGMATVEGSDLVLRHVVTNRSGELLHFRGAANVPGRERQYRPFSGMRPGDTQTVEYRFSKGANLAGTKVRLGLREMNDGSRTHALELIVP